MQRRAASRKTGCLHINAHRPHVLCGHPVFKHYVGGGGIGDGRLRVRNGRHRLTRTYHSRAGAAPPHKAARSVAARIAPRFEGVGHLNPIELYYKDPLTLQGLHQQQSINRLWLKPC